MGWENKVSGGVAPPVLEVRDPTGRLTGTVTFPGSAVLKESFDVVAVRQTAITGERIEIPRGFRYRAVLELPYIDVATWLAVVGCFSSHRSGAGLVFYPHGDYRGIFYDVAPAATFALPYVSAKYLGYAGNIEMTGTRVLKSIPAEWTWNYFCAVGETEYEPADVSFFTEAGEGGYDPAEVSFFSGAECPG